MTSTIDEKDASKQLFVNKQYLSKLYENCIDFIVSPIEIEDQPYMMLMYLQTLVDEPRINEAIVTPIIDGLKELAERDEKISFLQQVFEIQQFPISKIDISGKTAEINDMIAAGNVAIFIDGEKEAIVIDFIHLEQRAIEEPTTEMTIRGPKDGFNESLQTNLNLLRQRVHSNRLNFRNIRWVA